MDLWPVVRRSNSIIWGQSQVIRLITRGGGDQRSFHSRLRGAAQFPIAVAGIIAVAIRGCGAENECQQYEYDEYEDEGEACDDDEEDDEDEEHESK